MQRKTSDDPGPTRTATFSERARARGAWISLASQVAAAAMAYALQIVLARSLGTAGFGVYAAAMAWVGPLAVLAGLGLPQVALRFLPAYKAEGDAERLAGFLRAAERVTLAGAAIFAAAGSGVALAVASDPVPIVVALWTLPLTVQLRFHAEVARAAGRYEAAFVMPLVQPLVMLAGALLAKEVLGGLTPALGLCLPALGVLAVLPWQRTIARRIAPDARPRYETRAWLRAGMAMLAVDAAFLLLSQADAALLGALDARAVGLFSVASATAAFSMFPMVAVGSTAVPAFARLWALGRTRELERLARQATLRALLAQAAVAAAVVALAGPLLALYGGDFAEARVALLFILAGQLANTATGYVGSIMNMTGHQGAVLRSVGWAAGLHVGMLVVFVRAWGVSGAAAATALSSLGWNVWLYRLVRRHVGVRVSVVDAAGAWWGERAGGQVEAGGGLEEEGT